MPSRMASISSGSLLSMTDAKAADQARAVIDHTFRRPIAADAWRASARAARIATAAGGRTVARDALFQQAELRIDRRASWMRRNDVICLYVAFARAFIADGRIAGADRRSLGRQFRLALQHLDHQVDDGRDLVGFRRAAGHVVIHIDHLVQRAEARGTWLGCVISPSGIVVVMSAGRIRSGLSVETVLKAVSKISLQGCRIGQSGNAAFAGAGAKCDQDLGLSAQQLGNVLIFVVADAAVEQRQQDRAVLHRLDILVFGIHGHRPEDHLEVGVHIQDLLVDVQDGDLTAAAGGCPVHGEFWFCRCALMLPPPQLRICARSGWPLPGSCQLVGQLQRAQRANFLHQFG